MRIEIIIFLITVFLIANLYYDGKLVKKLFSFKKYYQMAGIGLAGLFFYYMIKKNPLNAGQMISTTNDYLKYLPIDKGTSNLLNPILDFTSKQNYNNDEQLNTVGNFIVHQENQMGGYEKKILNSGKKATKRSVSETKKKFVAARQNWKCGDCQDQLNAWFEVDHKIRLEYGGSNHVDNLVALCRDCHGKKTTIENL
tara:strand:- start:2081 stop:2671 length:591 start_codon:yes stop_codon:yes gene_type:complete